MAGVILATFSGARTVQPAWFSRLVSVKPIENSFELDGANVHYLHWQNPGKPGLLFVHGHAANAHWWDFIAPSFLDDFNIAAIDLSGSGDSDHRSQYSAELFARELTQCIEHAGLTDVTVIGHSFGGAMTRVAAHLFPEAFKACILVDSSIPVKKGLRQPPPMPKTRTRFYDAPEVAMKRFRLRPAQPVSHEYVVEHIARHSIRQTDDGWCFKLDPAVFARMPADDSMPVASDMIKGLQLPVGLIFGRQSKFFPPKFVQWLPTIIAQELTIGIDEAWHHVFLDQPLLFTEKLNELLGRLNANHH